MSSPSPINYGRLRPSSSPGHPDPKSGRSPSRRRCLFLFTAALFLVAASSVVTIAIVKAKGSDRHSPIARPTKAISRACGLTLYPSLCIQSLVGFPGALTASGDDDLVPISVNLTLNRFGHALSGSSEIGSWEMDSIGRSAYEDCIELLDDSVDLLARSLLSLSPADDGGGGSNKGSTEDVMTWLSAALTNQDTCTAGLALSSGTVKTHMSDQLRDLSELVSNSLALYAAVYGGGGGSDFSGVPIHNRRLMSSSSSDPTGFPEWMSRRDREALESTPTTAIQADVVVSAGGESGTVKKISEAIKKAPEKSDKRFIIHIKAGRYEESNLKIGRKKTNVWIIGDGRGKTVIAGSKNVAQDLITTFHTATFAATGTGFVAKDITFVNDAGPGNHQAVALRVGADHAVVYRCEIKGYQDTLYTHSQRQFYRECDIYGTVDFIFGNAAVVFQHCTMWARKPNPQQKNTITAQNRKDPNQNTGMSIHECQVKATTELEPVKATYPTFLGRPWKVYSRVVYMMSYIGDHVDPQGWLEWNSTSPVDSLYYGEFMNTGPRADTSGRVKWPGMHVNMSMGEANNFTVAEFIFGSAWLAPTGVAFQAGLSGVLEHS
ncbi:hypothetical protein V2J09_001913 [Rumex salicifolius]